MPVKLPKFKPSRVGTCQGCESEHQDLRRRCGEFLCRSCWLLNEHIHAEPDCALCKQDKCPYQGGDATE